MKRKGARRAQEGFTLLPPYDTFNTIFGEHCTGFWLAILGIVLWPNIKNIPRFIGSLIRRYLANDSDIVAPVGVVALCVAIIALAFVSAFGR